MGKFRNISKCLESEGEQFFISMDTGHARITYEKKIVYTDLGDGKKSKRTSETVDVEAEWKDSSEIGGIRKESRHAERNTTDRSSYAYGPPQDYKSSGEITEKDFYEAVEGGDEIPHHIKELLIRIPQLKEG